MTSFRALLRHAAVVASVLSVTAVGLGLVTPAPARASCAGPQLALAQRGAAVPGRRVGDGDHGRVVHQIDRGQPLRVIGTNLTFGCQDTSSITVGGCGAPVPDPVEPAVPMNDPELVLTQGSRRWTLGQVGTIGTDLTAQVEVELPPAVRPGSAVLALVDSHEPGEARVELLIA